MGVRARNLRRDSECYAVCGSFTVKGFQIDLTTITGFIVGRGPAVVMSIVVVICCKKQLQLLPSIIMVVCFLGISHHIKSCHANNCHFRRIIQFLLTY